MHVSFFKSGLKGAFTSPDGWHLLLCSGVLETMEQTHHDISGVPKVPLWDAGYHHPDNIAKAFTSSTLADLTKQPYRVAAHILSICKQYSSEQGEGGVTCLN